MGLSSGALASHAKADCQDAMTQTAMNICSAEAYQAEDARLNQNYKALRAKLSAEQKADLKNVQLTWLKYRDQQCAFESARYEGGSIYPLIVSGCLHKLTQQRNAVLSELLSQPR
jgi:uncharacterized protein YecT (DUF1311 family)